MSQKSILQLHVNPGQHLRASTILRSASTEFAKQVPSRLTEIAHTSRIPQLFFSLASVRVGQVCQMLMNL